jgi:hypothetical protein
MRTCRLFVALLLLSCARFGYGMATEQIGPDKDRRIPTAEQPGWPARMIEILRHDSRVYSIWVNGNENFYFKATPDQIAELINRYSETRLRDHVLIIKNEKKEIRTFNGDKVDYSVNFHFLGGIALAVTREKGDAETYEPTLTISVDPAADQAFWKKVALPDNIILINETANCPLKGKAIKPKRSVWFARMNFDDSTPAADFGHGVHTIVTLWEKGVKTGIQLGKVNHEGHFHAAFSEKEIADLKAGKSWLTLTVGNWLTEAREDHPKLSIEKLSLDKGMAEPVTVASPEYYYGRILFEDGSPPILVPAPWPGARISVDFPYAGMPQIDSEGYFQVYFTKEQYEKVKADKARKNIYIPNYEQKGSSTARFEFPAARLSRGKGQAGVVKIPFPGPQKEGSAPTP